jgi:uncharacterized membrane protein
MKIKGTTIHFVLTITWIALLLPTILWWKESILWLALISVYANIATHWGGYQAARVEENN